MLPEVQEIVDSIKILNQELSRIRKECQHTHIKYRYKSNTGNWCDSDNSYWVEYVCNHCGHIGFIDRDIDPEGYKLQGIIGSIKKEKFNE